MISATEVQPITTCQVKGLMPFRPNSKGIPSCRHETMGNGCLYGNLTATEVPTTSAHSLETNRVCLFTAARQSILGMRLGEIKGLAEPDPRFTHEVVALERISEESSPSTTLADVLTNEDIVGAVEFAKDQIDYHNQQFDDLDFHRKDDADQEAMANTHRHWLRCFINDIAYLIQSGKLKKVFGQEAIREIQKTMAPYVIVGQDIDVASRE
jgi:hypothetical protein